LFNDPTVSQKSNDDHNAVGKTGHHHKAHHRKAHHGHDHGGRVGHKRQAEGPAQSNQEQAINEAFEALVYRAQTTQLSLFDQYQQASAAASAEGDDGQAATQLQAQQMSFSFFAETRVEELIQFGQRTEKVSEGLEGPQQTSFIEASRSVSARFEISFSISGQSLNGFANGAEGLQNNAEMLEQFLGMSQQLLQSADGLFNEVMTLFDGFFGDSGEDGLGKLVSQLLGSMNEIMNGFFQGAAPPTGPALPGGAGSAAPAQATTSSMQLEFNFEFKAEFSTTVVQESDPVMLDLDGDGFELSSYKDGAQFDILGNGGRQNTAFVRGGDAFLAMDRNLNGLIDSGLELFGDQHGAKNGYEELGKLDGNNDGFLNRLDPNFNLLKLFQDNGNGRTEKGELFSLAEAGISEINLQYREVNIQAQGGNRLAQIAQFKRTDGTTGNAADAILNYTT
jgi:hypothetical protein